MPLFGVHTSTAGGLHKALLTAQTLGCATVQVFTGSPQMWAVTAVPANQAPSPAGNSASNGTHWRARELTPDEVRTFRRTLRQTGLRYPTVHDSYLINLASPEESLYRRSIEAFAVELKRAEQLGLRYVVAHPGAHLDSGEEAGLDRVARALDEIHQRLPGLRVRTLLETTAGQGTTLGHRFEHLARILALVAAPQRLGVCLDTCHVFAAGYALAPAREYQATMKAFARTIGFRWLKVFHVNDSKKPLGSRIDRHAHVGKGELGLEPFRLLVNDPRFRRHPMILETPKEEGDNKDMDPVNLATLRGLVETTPQTL